MVTWLVILVIGLPWAGALAVWLVRDQRSRWQHALAATFAIATAAASLALLPLATDQVVLSLPVGGIFGVFTFVPDGMGVLLAAIAAVVGGLAVIYSIDYMSGEAQLGRYYALVLLFIGAMIGLVLAGSLLLLFLFWEVTAFCSYALISFHNDDPRAVAGGIKALLITQIGGAGLLVGALLVYSYLGSYQISVFLASSTHLPAGVLAIIGFGYLIAAIAKSAQVPLHTWLPDAMEAPTPVTALIHAATMVNAGVYLLARFYPVLAPIPGWKTAVIVIGLLSALLAAVLATFAFDLKRVLAYSTISQLGTMFYAVGVGALFASQLHLFSHALFKGLLFLGAGAVIHAVGTRDMRQMGGLGPQLPFVRTVFVIGALALAGIPITNGFYSKELLLEGGLAYGPAWAYWLMVFGAGITGLYTSRMVALLFWGQAGESPSKHVTGRMMGAALSVLAAGVLLSWLLMGPLSTLLSGTLPQIYGMPTATTWEIVVEVIASPATWLALLVVLLGAGLWLVYERRAFLERPLATIGQAAQYEFGFEWLNRRVVGLVQHLSATVARTQTGQLNWNVAGIAGALIVLLSILVWGSR